MSKEYFVVAVVAQGEGHPPSYMALDNRRRFLTPRGCLEHIRDVSEYGFFYIEAMEDAPEGVPAGFAIPLHRVIQWHIVEAPDATA
jgi:hypothetical protein